MYSRRSLTALGTGAMPFSRCCPRVRLNFSFPRWEPNPSQLHLVHTERTCLHSCSISATPTKLVGTRAAASSAVIPASAWFGVGSGLGSRQGLAKVRVRVGGAHVEQQACAAAALLLHGALPRVRVQPLRVLHELAGQQQHLLTRQRRRGRAQRLHLRRANGRTGEGRSTAGAVSVSIIPTAGGMAHASRLRNSRFWV